MNYDGEIKTRILELIFVILSDSCLFIVTLTQLGYKTFDK